MKGQNIFLQEQFIISVFSKGSICLCGDVMQPNNFELNRIMCAASNQQATTERRKEVESNPAHNGLFEVEDAGHSFSTSLRQWKTAWVSLRLCLSTSRDIFGINMMKILYPAFICSVLRARAQARDCSLTSLRIYGEAMFGHSGLSGPFPCEPCCRGGRCASQAAAGLMAGCTDVWSVSRRLSVDFALDTHHQCCSLSVSLLQNVKYGEIRWIYFVEPSIIGEWQQLSYLPGLGLLFASRNTGASASFLFFLLSDLYFFSLVSVFLVSTFLPLVCLYLCLTYCFCSFLSTVVCVISTVTVFVSLLFHSFSHHHLVFRSSPFLSLSLPYFLPLFWFVLSTL